MRKILLTIILLLVTNSVFAKEGNQMNEEEAQQVWDEYNERIKNRRLAEADILISELEKNNINEATAVALDFTHFCHEKSDAEDIKNQLSENYTMSLEYNKDSEYWLIKGTSRPYGVTLSSKQHKAWVEFMLDVGKSYRCVFSTWSMTEPKSKKTYSNEEIETEFD